MPAPTGRRLALFLGSTIGNLDAPARQRLLADLRALLPDPGDRLLLGVDLVKDVKVLEAAYDDSAASPATSTAISSRVINHAVDGDFEPEAFRHHAFYNEVASRIEMHLVADTAQTVQLRRLGLTVRFQPGEGIWTEKLLQVHRASASRPCWTAPALDLGVARGPRQLLRPRPRRAAPERGGRRPRTRSPRRASSTSTTI